MDVLVVGSGGRENALVSKIGESDYVDKIYTAPGNGGTARLSQNVPIESDEISNLVSFADERRIGLTVVGPENPLADGIVDVFNQRGLRIFGPSKSAAQIEASKAYSKRLMREAGIPTAEAGIFHNYGDVLFYLRQNWENGPLVPKGSGLAGGKAVLVSDTLEEAEQDLRRLMVDREFGSAGDVVVLERRLYGPEVSHIGFASGRDFMAFPPTQDYKPVGDGNIGPNTGGMGSYSPRDIDPDLLEIFNDQVMLPVLHYLESERDIDYKGVLYGGLILTEEGPKVLEFNCRFGDPETQPTLMRMRSDIVPYMEACIDGGLDEMPPIEWDPRYALCLVLASGGYPVEYETGKLITGLERVEEMDDVIVYHAGTKLIDGKVYTAGGRVLGVTALGDTLEEARKLAYEAANSIYFEDMVFRNDIGLL